MRFFFGIVCARLVDGMPPSIADSTQMANRAKQRTPVKQENMMTTELNPSEELELFLFISSNLILCADLPCSHQQPVQCTHT